MAGAIAPVSAPADWDVPRERRPTGALDHDGARSGRDRDWVRAPLSDRRYLPGGRARLRSETPRGGCPRTVLRATPCLFGLHSVVELLYHAMREATRSGASAGRAGAG